MDVFLTTKTWFMTHYPEMVSALVFFTVGFLIVYTLKRLFGKRVLKHNDKMIISFLINFGYTVALFVLVIITLTKLGVPTASLIAVLGAAGLAIGLALKDSLSNVAAGFLIIFFKPFKVGDFIDVKGATGTVTRLNVLTTQLKTIGNEVLFIPNNQVITNTLVNRSFHKQRRFDLTIGIHYSADIKQAKAIILQALESCEHIAKKPEPVLGVQALADSAIELRVRVWAQRDQITSARFEALEAIKYALDAARIEIPFPQVDVHMRTSTAE